MRFVFDEIKAEVYVVEGGMNCYEHFNFTAKQAGSMVLFFAEVVPKGDTCDVLCCKPLECNDNGMFLNCTVSSRSMVVLYNDLFHERGNALPLICLEFYLTNGRLVCIVNLFICPLAMLRVDC